MNYFVSLVEEGPDDEEVVLDFDGVRLKCFASFCPFKLNLGKMYEVELELTLNESLVLKESKSADKKMEGDSFSYGYSVTGRLKKGAVFSLIELFDEGFLEFPMLESKFVEFKVDRLDVSFVKPIG